VGHERAHWENHGTNLAVVTWWEHTTPASGVRAGRLLQIDVPVLTSIQNEPTWGFGIHLALTRVGWQEWLLGETCRPFAWVNFR